MLALLLLALAAPTPVPLPGGAPGIGFDDLTFAPPLGRLLVPAGRTGDLDLVDPETLHADPISGFSNAPKHEGGHDFGVTSADMGGDLVFATDRTSRELVVVDPRSRRIAARAPLGAEPDYVRFVPPASVWVTEPEAERIEIFSLGSRGATPVRAGAIRVPGGPESLVVDAAAGRAYANLWHGATVAIDLAHGRVAERWPSGCEKPRGLALDRAARLLLVGCAEGRVSAIDARTGRLLASVAAPEGIDIVAFDPSRRHLYAPGGRAERFATFGVGRDGKLEPLRSEPAPRGAHCVATDGRGHAFVCDPTGGRLWRYDDPR